MLVASNLGVLAWSSLSTRKGCDLAEFVCCVTYPAERSNRGGKEDDLKPREVILGFEVILHTQDVRGLKGYGSRGLVRLIRGT